MKRYITVFILFIGILALNNCGFKPIYKLSDESLTSTNYIVEFTNETSLKIRNKIEEIFQTKSSESFYKIYLNVRQSTVPLVINTNGTVDKYRVEIVLDFTVHEKSSNEKVYSNIVRGFAEYLVQNSEIETNKKFSQSIDIATQKAVQMMLTKIQSNILSSK